MLSQPDSETCQTSRGVNCGRCAKSVGTVVVTDKLDKQGVNHV